jgi:hypothetical protein
VQHRQRRPLVVGQRPPLRYFPRDVFFCFLTFKLCIGTFAAVPRETGLATPCFFDFPAMLILLDRGRVATGDPTLQAAAPMRCPKARSRVSPERSLVQ